MLDGAEGAVNDREETTPNGLQAVINAFSANGLVTPSYHKSSVTIPESLDIWPVSFGFSSILIPDINRENVFLKHDIYNSKRHNLILPTKMPVLLKIYW